jgi:hypothetical protein
VSSLEPGDRRRLLVAGITTIAALPLLLGGRGGAGVATIGQQADIAAALDASTSEPTPGVPTPTPVADDNSPIGFMRGPPPATLPAVVQIAVPGSGPGSLLEGTASFERFASEGDGYGQPCELAGPAVGAIATVVNLDNGRSTSCTVIGPPRPGARVTAVLSSTAFSQIADLGQAPIHVRISW